MKTLFKKIIAALVVILIVSSSFAISDDVLYSGYYVDKIINNTTKLFLGRNLLSDLALDDWRIRAVDAERQQTDGILPVFPFINFEQDFVNYCVAKKFITTAQATLSIYKSRQIGGLEINGYNLLYLHALLLEDLIGNKYITKKEAQDLLNSSRKED